MMAGESSTGFEDALGSSLDRDAVSHQSGAIDSTSEVNMNMNMIPMGGYYGIGSTGGMMLPGNINSSVIVDNNGMVRAGDSVPGLMLDGGLAVEWSAEEQYTLEEGLVKYAEEESIMRYIKVAAMLRDKNVRDVALRCRWMMRKRRKADERHAGKKVNSRKDKLVESSSKANIPMSTTTYSHMWHHVDQSELSGISGPAKHLLEQNYQTFRQITINLSNYNLLDNIDLFCRTRSNILAILNNMGDMPGGITNKMPPLPVSINDDLANNILPSTVQNDESLAEPILDQRNVSNFHSMIQLHRIQYLLNYTNKYKMKQNQRD